MIKETGCFGGKHVKDKNRKKMEEWGMFFPMRVGQKISSERPRVFTQFSLHFMFRHEMFLRANA